MKYLHRPHVIDNAIQFDPTGQPLPAGVKHGLVHGGGEGFYVDVPGTPGVVPVKAGQYLLYRTDPARRGCYAVDVVTADDFFARYQTEEEANAPLAVLAARVSELDDMFKTARNNCRAIADDRDEARQLHASAVRQYQAARAEAEGLKAELAIVTRRLAQAKTQLEAHGQLMPEEPRHDGGWYSCAVCSKKTNEAPALSNRHPCCSRDVHIGPCCAGAVERSLDHVTDIMAGMGHVAGCTNNGRSP